MHRRRLLFALVPLGTAVLLYPSAAGWTGTVVGPDGPVAGASVRRQAGDWLGHTDANGRFRFTPAAGRVTAWKPGFVIGGDRLETLSPTIVLRPLPTTDDDRYRWVSPAPSPTEPGQCGNCHPAIWREWASGGHARSVTGRQFQDLYAGTDALGRAAVGWGLLSERPDGAGVCASCHAPTVRDTDPALYDLRQAQGVDRHGVHCDYCHKVAGLADGEIGLTHGRFLHQLLRPAEGQLFFGPLDDVDRGEETYSPFLRDSRFCAACHEGTVFGVPVYTTYSEWRASGAARRGQQCQTCHMRPTGRMGNFAPGAGGIDRDPRTLANHHFWDGSQLAMLRRALRMEPTINRAAGRVSVEIRLSAPGAGHRVPTGFIDRHLLLIVEARGSDGGTLAHATGPTLPAWAGPELVGQPGRFFGRVLRDEAGRGPLPFWHRGVDAVDSRLFSDRDDVCRFEFPLSTTTVRIRLLHRRFFAEVARQKGWPCEEQTVLDRVVMLPR